MIKRVTCSVRRGSQEESQHKIHCVVLNQDNKIIFQSGNIDKNHCLRSTLKPFQSAAAINCDTHKKYSLTQKEVAITCASHHCEQEHIKTIQSILKKINLSEKNLACGFHFPFDKTSKAKLYSKEIEKSNIYNNCSGKHSGLLAMMQNLNMSTSQYIHHDHPIHQHINNYIISLTNQQPKELAIDGCSLPTPYFSLLTLAEMYMKLISAPKNSPLSIVCQAMMAFPTMVSGTKGFDSYFMKTLNGRSVCKGGAEGMQALAFKTQRGKRVSLSLKVLDGNHRGNYISCITILNYLKLITKEEYISLLGFVNENQYNLNKIKTGKLVCNIID